MKKKMKKISERAIRAMPYETRLRNYEREKNAMFNKIAGLPASEVAQKHADLAKKWGV